MKFPTPLFNTLQLIIQESIKTESLSKTFNITIDIKPLSPKLSSKLKEKNKQSLDFQVILCLIHHI